VSRSNFYQNSLTAGIAAAINPWITNDLRVNRSSATAESNWVTSYADGAAKSE
jgi:hypothetical protein